ncbi:hypothetical protein J6590_103054 [Homalodisca vitripennis]|nr:hypothetical protein J6590_103054 [Homalodisca vitripennis]
MIGEYQNISRHLDSYSTAQPAGAELVLTTLPYCCDLDADHPIDEETVLVNAFTCITRNA